MFCPADQPMLRRETVEGLLHCALDQKDRIWRTCSDGLPGSPVIFPKWAFEELKRLPEGKGGSWVLKEHPDQVAMMEVSDVHELMDVDTPDALELLKDYSVKVKYD
jgi:molybdenum cofactor cytidylyltransferase